MSKKETPQKQEPAYRRLRKEDMVKIAMARFRPLLVGKSPASYASLRKQFPEQFPWRSSTLAHAVREAFRLRLVELQRRPARLKIQRVPLLEEALLQAYPDLQQAIVVSEQADATADPAHQGDQLHQKLGQAMAQWLMQATPFRENDVICLGSGRGVYFSAAGVRRPFSLRNVTLVSLTGAVFPEMHAEASAGLDADFHVGLLGMRFPAANCKNVLFPIALRKGAQRTRESTPLGPGRWDAEGLLIRGTRVKPTFAIVGVGVLEGGHRFAASDRPDILAPIGRPLDELLAITRKYDPCPVADICNRLFLVSDDRGRRPSAADRREMSRLIGVINERLLTVTEQQIAQIQSIALVAGTERKAHAIRSLLEGNPWGQDAPKLDIRILCADSIAARHILEAG